LDELFAIGFLSGLGEVERQMVIKRTQETITHRRETGEILAED
tara:strand:+ start:139 stop:267 length:129 start_codon:yes stop_codon:yes gene_type:complete